MVSTSRILAFICAAVLMAFSSVEATGGFNLKLGDACCTKKSDRGAKDCKMNYCEYDSKSEGFIKPQYPCQDTHTHTGGNYTDADAKYKCVENPPLNEAGSVTASMGAVAVALLVARMA